MQVIWNMIQYDTNIIDYTNMETTKKRWSFFFSIPMPYTLVKKWDLQTCYMHLEIASNCQKTWQQLSTQVVWVWAHLAVANTWGWEDQGLQLLLRGGAYHKPQLLGHQWAPLGTTEPSLAAASANFRRPRFFGVLRLARRLLPCAAPAKLEAAWSPGGPHPARSADLLNTSPGMVMDWSPAASGT